MGELAGAPSADEALARVPGLVLALRPLHRELERLGEVRRAAGMVQVAVRHQDQVYLADLVQVLELGRDLGRTHDPRIDHDHLAAGRREQRHCPAG